MYDQKLACPFLYIHQEHRICLWKRRIAGTGHCSDRYWICRKSNFESYLSEKMNLILIKKVISYRIQNLKKVTLPCNIWNAEIRLFIFTEAGEARSLRNFFRLKKFFRKTTLFEHNFANESHTYRARMKEMIISINRVKVFIIHSKYFTELSKIFS